MRRCYRGTALVVGAALISSLVSYNSCGIGTLTVYAAEDTLTEEMETAFQEEVQTGEENVETEIPVEETDEEAIKEALLEKMMEEPPIEEEDTEESAEEPALDSLPEEVAEEGEKEPSFEEAALEVSEEEPDAEKADGNNYDLAEQEYQVLLKIVEAEAGGEDTAGKMLVANVVMNRVQSGEFPNTISEVVYERNGGAAQFSPTANGRIDEVDVSEDTVDAVSRVLSGEDDSNGALFFRSVNSSNGWFDQSLNRVLEHGNHIFYTM